TIAWDRRANDFDWSRTTCLPDSMRRAFAREPLWVDLTGVRLAARYSLRDAPFRDAVATLLAPLRGLTKDAVESEDLRQRRTAVRMLRGAVAALSLLLATSLAAGGLAWQQRNEAVTRARISASQALAARALEEAPVNPAKAASFALYADQAGHTGESDRALAQAVVANEYTARHVQGGAEGVNVHRGPNHGPMTRVAVSRDGGVLAYYSDYNAEADKLDYPPTSQRYIHLYDLRVGKPLPSLPTKGWPDHGLADLRLSSDGGTLVVENYDNQLEVWDVRQARLTRQLVAKNGYLFSAIEGVTTALSGDGHWLAAVYHSSREGEGELLDVWDLTSGTPVVSGESLGTTVGAAISFDGSGRLSLMTPATGQIRTLTPQSRSWSTRTLPGFRAKDYTTVVSASGDRALTTGSDSGQEELWDLTQGRRLATGAPRTAWTSLLLPDNSELIVGADGPTLSLYDSRLRKKRTLGSFSRDVTSVAASGDGTWVAAASIDGSISLFGRTSRSGHTVPNGDGLTAAEITSAGRLGTRRMKDGGTEIWTVDDPTKGPRKLGRIPLEFTETGYDLAATGDGTRVALTYRGELSVWDPRTGSRISASRYGTENWVVPSALSFLGDDFHVVLAAEHDVLVIDVRSGEITQRLTGSSIAISVDRKSLVTLTFGRLHDEPDKIAVWRWSGNGRVEQVGNGATVENEGSLMVSNDGSKVALVDEDRRVSIIDVATGRTVTTAGAEQPLANYVVFSADSLHVAQVSGDGAQSALQIWDASTGDPLALWPLDLAEPTDPTTKDAPHIVSSSGGGVLVYAPDGTLLHRVIESAPWREALCALTPGSLPAKEYDRYLKDIGVSAPCRG
ncbi:WD40 repeat domain-containing protein, partial [Streptomyces spororaveus]